MNMDLKGFWLGLKASIIASCCCSLPIALVMVFGVLVAGSATAALKIPKYKWYFIAISMIFLTTSLYLRIRKTAGKCEIADVKREKELVILSVASYIVLTILLVYLILPLITYWVLVQ